ncbi:ABC transporter ATP-binding protein [Knoellia sp. p5-6-4]|uniref:ABC transporter ATP-binding protein n=1 Tax=unclassified Knoellia TaxID=2618719 RepID=UPI0023DC2923|nr:ABC transporter ATP-binding protein [Knoellia sp. p5-6-4]MDF2144318.1 ABC transporter ATP-binding protein [Knoellia sp. p5-6-4]
MGRHQPTLSEAVPSLRHTMRMLGPYVRSQRALLAGGLVAMLAEVAFRLLEPWPLKVVIDAVVAPGAAGQPGITRLLVLASLAIVAVAALRAGASYLSTVCLALAGTRAMTQVRAVLFDHLLGLSLRYHGTARTGDLVTRLITDVGRLQDVAVTAALPLVGNVITLVGMVVVMMVLDPLMGLIVVAALPVFVLMSGRRSRRITGAAREQRRREGQLANTAAEGLGAMPVVHAYGLERVLRGQFAASNQRSLTEGARATRLSAGLERHTDLLVGVATAAVVLVGATRVLHGELTVGELVVFVSYLKGAFKPMRDMAKYTGRIAKAAASGERILGVLAVPADVTDRPDAVVAPRLRGELRLEDVTVDFGRGEPALRGVSLHVPAGTRLGLVGPSGSGKSTVAALLLRLHDVDSGRVLIDGVDVRGYVLASLRAQQAIVLQESVLFAGSVRENIRLGRPDASDADVERAARLARAHTFITEVLGGYDALLGERGATLSGGQRQRLAIARAILRDPSVIILDEATTGLDPVNQREVQTALSNLCSGRTAVVISHDLHAVLDCDVVACLDGGRVVEVGPPAELLARRDGVLATLHQLDGSGGRSGALT